MDVLLQDDTELPSNLEEDEILDIAKLRFQAFCHQSGRFEAKKDISKLEFMIPYRFTTSYKPESLNQLCFVF